MKSPLPLLLSLAAVAAQAGAAPPTVQVSALFRVLKADGVTVIGQAVVAPGGGPLAMINVNRADALVAADGRCAFNVRYDEVANAAISGTTNRIFSNDKLIAQNTAIDLQPGVLRSITTQPYLFAGNNNVKIVVNAAASNPGVGWVRINVAGECQTKAPKPVPAPLPDITPPSSQWKTLFNAWGYSNYAVTQLKGKNFARYGELAELNAALGTVVKALKVDAAAYNRLMAHWNTLANDRAFKAAMAAITRPAGSI